MNEELRKAFNETIHGYKKTLVNCAKRCEWDTFKLIAGKLFDYVETIEVSELERRFFRVFRLIMIALFLMIVCALRVDPASYPEIEGLKRFMTLTAIGGSCFELYFFLNFRLYMEHKTTFYKTRKARFIKNIEKDFRGMLCP